MKLTFAQDIAIALTGIDSDATANFLEMMMSVDREWVALSAWWRAADEEDQAVLWNSMGLDLHKPKREVPQGIKDAADRMLIKAGEILGA